MADRASMDFTALTARVRQMHQEVVHLQSQMAAVEASGFGGDGLVRATVAGDGRLTGLVIDPSVIDPSDPETLAALVVAAVESARLGVVETRVRQLDGMTAGLGDITGRVAPR